MNTQRYNKGSGSLPTVHGGNANMRHFARAVAQVSYLTVEVNPNSVTVFHYDGDSIPFVDDIADGWDMSRTFSSDEIAIYRYRPFGEG